MQHNCRRNPDLLAPPPDLSTIRPIWTSKDNDKAYLDLTDNKVRVNPDYARSLSPDSLRALYYHELAHAQPNSNARKIPGQKRGCERCADERMGVCLAASGLSRPEAIRALDGLSLKRGTARVDMLAGYDLFVNKTAPTSTPDNSNTQTRYVPPVKAPTPSPVSEKVPENAPDVPLKESAETAGTVETPQDCNCPNLEWIVGVFGGLMAVTIAYFGGKK